MRSSKQHVSGQGEMDLGQMRAPVVTLPERRVSYSSWLAFYSPLSSRGQVVERNGVTVKLGSGSDLFGGAL